MKFEYDFIIIFTSVFPFSGFKQNDKDKFYEDSGKIENPKG